MACPDGRWSPLNHQDLRTWCPNMWEVWCGEREISSIWERHVSCVLRHWGVSIGSGSIPIATEGWRGNTFFGGFETPKHEQWIALLPLPRRECEDSERGSIPMHPHHCSLMSSVPIQSFKWYLYHAPGFMNWKCTITSYHWEMLRSNSRLGAGADGTRHFRWGKVRSHQSNPRIWFAVDRACSPIRRLCSGSVRHWGSRSRNGAC